jgi:integrase/recombinase XerD
MNGVRKPSPRPTPAWDEAAEDWLTAKRVSRRQGDPGHSDRARRADLRRWAGAINTDPGVLVDWGRIGAELGDSDTLLRALDVLAGELADSSRQRMLSTLRGFTSYLTRRGLLMADPCDAEELTVRVRPDGEVRALTEDELAAMVDVAGREAPARVLSAWPTRDVAIVAVLATCGLRVNELCALTVTAIDRTGPQALLRVTAGAKGGRKRTVPIPADTLALVDAYLAERADPRGVVFVRADRSRLNQQFIDSLLRRLVRTAAVTTPDGAMAHALRHSYGMRLALRGVPLPVIQQLLGHRDPRTSAIYTAAHATDLTAALDQAGLL